MKHHVLLLLAAVMSARRRKSLRSASLSADLVTPPTLVFFKEGRLIVGLQPRISAFSITAIGYE